MKGYDVVVIGAGPSGLAAARSAATEGAKTLVLEMRAGIAPHAPFPILISPPLHRGLSDVVWLGEFALHSRSVTTEVKGPRIAAVDSWEFAKRMKDEASEAGAELWISAPASGFLTKQGRVVGVRVGGKGWLDEVRAEVVIDASGASGPWSSLFLREIVGRRRRREEELFVSEYLLSKILGMPSFHFSPYLTLGGYGWLIPGVRGVTSVGVRGRIHSDTALDEFVGRLALQPEVASPIAVHRRILPASGSLEKSAHDGALAVGSTAGQASQVALGSLRYSLGCGDIAGKIAVEAITEGNVSRARLAEYENLWGEEFGRELESYSALHHSLAALSDRGWDELLGILGGSPPLGRAFLDLLLAREPGRAFEVLLGEESVRAVLRLAGTSARFRGGG